MRSIMQGLLATTLATCIAGTAAGQTITQWNFNSNPADASTSTGTLLPSTGAGTFALFGSTTSTFAGGSPTDPAATDNSAVNTAAYPALSVGSGTAGVQVAVSTATKNNIQVSYDQRLSNTASAYWQFMYTTDGTNYTSTGLTDAGFGPGVYRFPEASVIGTGTPTSTVPVFAPTFTWNLSAITACNNNASFGFRIVSLFDPTTGSTSYIGAHETAPPTNNYSTAGTCRYDMMTVTQGLATGSCCLTGDVVCHANFTQAACGSGIWSNGAACAPSQCSGVCCTGKVCAVPVSPVDCANQSTQQWIQAATACSPNPCPIEVKVLAGDIAYAADVSALNDSVQQIRGATGASPSPSRVGTWGNVPFVEFVQFDNTGGPHAAAGNLLGLDFGASATAGGLLYNLSTDGSGTAQTVYQFNTGNPLGFPVSRVGGFGVSPDNKLLGIVCYDTGQVIIAEYSNGATPGTGAGASLTNGAATQNTNSAGPDFLEVASAVSGGVTWVTNTRCAVLVRSTDPGGVFAPNTIAIFTIDYNPVTHAITAVTAQVATDDTNVSDGSRYLGLAYAPTISPFVYSMSSGFTTALGSHARINAIDPATWTVVKSIQMDNPAPGVAPNGSLQTGRAIAVGADRYLYISEFAGSGTLSTDPIIDRINLDTQAPLGTVNAADAAAMTDNSSVDVWTAQNATTASFNGLDIAVFAPVVTTVTCCTAGVCTTNMTLAQCTAGGGTQNVAVACTPNPCPGVCCSGASCIANTLQAACTGANKKWVGSSVTCNLVGPPTDAGPINFKTPCCKGDFNHDGLFTTGDLFSFLTAWFGKTSQADINGNPAAGAGAITTADLFGFLTAWFGKGCS